MGCAAGKHVTASPELSSSPSSSNLNIKKENGLSTNKHEIPKQIMESSTNSRKDSGSSSGGSSVSSIKEPEIPEPVGNHAFKISKPIDEAQAKRMRELNSKAPKPVLIGQPKQEMSQSQVEFFRMLDQKIEEGPDYRSGDEDIKSSTI